MVPFANLFNHKPMEEAEAVWFYDEKRRGFIIKAYRDIRMNTEICFSYGETKGNMDFFMNYGFLTPANNDVDYMLIKLELDEEDPAY